MLKNMSLGESIKFEQKNNDLSLHFSKVLTKNENLTKVIVYLMQVENNKNGNIAKFPLIALDKINEYEEKVKDLTIVKRTKLKKYEVNIFGEFIK
jgi:hypothetical protein